MACMSNMTTVNIANCAGDSACDNVLERSIDLSIGILITLLNLPEVFNILKVKR